MDNRIPFLSPRSATTEVTITRTRNSTLYTIARLLSVKGGFEDHETNANMTAQVQTTQVEALIDLVCVNVPEIDINHIRAEATSLGWIYRYIREHYGVKRTGRQMMQKFGVLQRKDGERLNSFWNRFQGFYAENRIRKDDEIKITNSDGRLINAPADEKGERYSVKFVLGTPRIATRSREDAFKQA